MSITAQTAASETAASACRADSYPNGVYAWYVVVVLVLANIMSSVDRQLLALVVSPVRQDLQVTDTQISLLQGLAFAVFYAVMGLPLGLLADRTNRRNLIAIGVLVWSGMTVGCGISRTFNELFVARVGVGIGEAALLPAAYSMIADYFPSTRRGGALGVFTIAQFAGVGVSWSIGGAILKVVNAHDLVTFPVIGAIAPWKAAFIVVGSLGFVLLPLLVSVVEPRRREQIYVQRMPRHRTYAAFVGEHKRAFLSIYLVYALLGFVGYNFQAWLPTYFDRRYHVSPAVAGGELGIVIMVAGTLGCVFSSLTGDRWTRQGRVGGKFRLSIIWWTFAALATWMLYASSSPPLALLSVALLNFGAAIALSSAAAAIQDVVPNQFRGQATAVYLLLLGVLGFGAGPSAVAMVTDYVFHNDLGLVYSLLIVPLPAIALGLYLSLSGLKPYGRVLAEMRNVDG